MSDDEKVEIVNGLLGFFGGQHSYDMWSKLAEWAFGGHPFSSSPLWEEYERARGPTHGPSAEYDRRWKVAFYDHVLLKREGGVR